MFGKPVKIEVGPETRKAVEQTEQMLHAMVHAQLSAAKLLYVGLIVVAGAILIAAFRPHIEVQK